MIIMVTDRETSRRESNLEKELIFALRGGASTMRAMFGKSDTPEERQRRIDEAVESIEKEWKALQEAKAKAGCSTREWTTEFEYAKAIVRGE